MKAVSRSPVRTSSDSAPPATVAAPAKHDPIARNDEEDERQGEGESRRRGVLPCDGHRSRRQIDRHEGLPDGNTRSNVAVIGKDGNEVLAVGSRRKSGPQDVLGHDSRLALVLPERLFAEIRKDHQRRNGSQTAGESQLDSIDRHRPESNMSASR